MKFLPKLIKASTTLAIVAGVALVGGSKAGAISGPGQIVGGNSNYLIANVTQGTGFANTQSAATCDIVQYRLHLYNLGPTGLGDVKAEATINTMDPETSYVSDASVFTPDGLTQQVNFQNTLNISTPQTQSYIKNSTVLLDGAGNVLKSSANGTLADTVTMGGGGIDLGPLGESVQEYLEFKTQLSCPTPPPAPVYTCDILNITAGDNRTVKISAFTTTAQNGATFKDAVINWGDSSANLTTSSVVGQTHQYAADGTYTVAATAHFTVNGEDVTAGGPSCEQVITFSSTKPPIVTPPPSTPPSTPNAQTPAQPAPNQLVNTGAGNVVGLFGATSAIGAVAYRWLLGRRLSRQ